MKTLVTVIVGYALVAPSSAQAEWMDAGFFMHPFAGIVSPDLAQAKYWLEPDQPSVAVGYQWHRLKVEGAISAVPIDSVREPVKPKPKKLDSRSIRLSFSPAQDWTMAVSGRSVMGLDQVIPDVEIKRSLFSTSYTRAFDNGSWQTTVGWGRSARKFREPVKGYLVESLARFEGRNALFGRLEQVGSDELPRSDDSLQRQVFFKMNKLTIGYFHEFDPEGPVKADIGAMASRYFVPSAMESSYGSRPVTYMLFLRLRIR